MENPFEKLLNEIAELKQFAKDAIESGIHRNTPEPEEFLTVQRAADYTGLQVSTIYAYIRSRKIRHYKTGSKVYFKKSEINAYIERGLVQTKPLKTY
ncbi:helix-turn-helix domain-containing protein [Dyadobacter sp. CY327]|uniref:helix-turn-helix domain-containing protein n=1 Tax=Dyadobacter sp. CY327 TaxID=2907301 RepID=UPI001F28A4D0|nr:helix-turn-helix domain-containing protein [Dyadobacter sp. CY327]MCE7072011.1 helix-turn-helix domain-containing protein [Dyadobacter sp. CY327]